MRIPKVHLQTDSAGFYTLCGAGRGLNHVRAHIIEKTDNLRKVTCKSCLNLRKSRRGK